MSIELTTPGQTYTNNLSETNANSDTNVPVVKLAADGITFINYGRVESYSGFANAVVITGNGGTIDNRGTINGASSGLPGVIPAAAILGSAGADTLTNSGDIRGAIDLGGGNDIFNSNGSMFGELVFMGSGDDIYRRAGTISNLNVLDGGEGRDTLSIAGGYLSNVTSFEVLQITAGPPGDNGLLSTVTAASGFGQIDIASGAGVLFLSSINPTLDLHVDSGLVAIDEGSVFGNIIGSDHADKVTLTPLASVLGSISLGDGDDVVTMHDRGILTNSGTYVVDRIDGGEGDDRFAVIAGGRLSLDLSRITNVEHLSTSYGAATLTHVSGFKDIDAVGFVWITASDLRATSLGTTSVAVLNLAKDVVLGRIGAPDADLHKAELAAVQEGGQTRYLITNDGVILGDAQLGMGSDYFSGQGSVGGTIYGYAGGDTLFGGPGDDRLNGGYGRDFMGGGEGADTFEGTAVEMNGDTIVGFSAADRILFTDATLSTFSFARSGQTLTFSGGSLTLQDTPGGRIVASADPSGGVILTLEPRAQQNDFNGDNFSDILWRNDDGALTNWLGGSNGGFTQNAVAAVVPTDWRIAGTGDFNGDGISDLLWRNDNGALTDWLGSKTSIAVSNDANAYTVVSLDWQVAGTGDFNGDGRSDILWRNQDGRLSSWLGTSTGGFTDNAAAAGAMVATSWHVAGTGDFNGDGRSDILWRNDDGRLSNWLGTANGSFTDNGTASAALVPTSWHIAGTGDFNGDGRYDILWRNDDGRLVDWLGTANGGFTDNAANAAFTVATSWKVASTGDYNSDGRDDILWRNDDGRVTDWLGTANGGFTDNASVALTSFATSWHVAGSTDAQVHKASSDFNGDGRSDILWRNDNGALSNWLGTANGGFTDNGPASATTVSTSWHVAGTGDFNGDGRSDILWRNDNGQLSDWLGKANGGFTDNGAASAATVSIAWHIAGTGDFNGDGRSDILWRNDDGRLSNWLGNANGGFTDNGAASAATVSTAWHIAGTGDFNGDGRSDILWRNDNGQLSDWLGTANGGFTDNGAASAATVSTAWKIAGTGDFNGDGRSDILWRNDDGRLSDWLGTANGGFTDNGAASAATVSTDWKVAGTGDFNGDGFDDILWRNDDGRLSDWLGTTNGGFIDNGPVAHATVPIDWHTQNAYLFLV